MTRRILLILPVWLACFFFQGCASQSWFDAFKDIQRQECYKIESPTERQECLDKIDDASYDEYQKERKETISSTS
jgi:hypothetical protein